MKQKINGNATREGVISRFFGAVPPSYWLAGFIAIAVVGWMMSDNLLPSKPQEVVSSVEETIENKSQRTFIVSAVKVKNSKTDIVVRASGVTEATYRINMISRRNGLITKILAQEGADVKEGQILARLDQENLVADLEAAISAEKSAQKSFDISEKLGKQNFASSLELSQSEAALKQAKAQVEAIKQQLTFTKIIVPKAGRLETLSLEVGQFVQKDREVGTILGMEKMKIISPVPQTQIGKVSVNDLVRVSIPGLDDKIGVVKKIASAANTATRTFNVEVEVDNLDGTIRAGMSSEVSIVIDQANAFSVSPAHLAISDDGSLRVKTVNAENIVSIIDVTLVRASGNTAFVSGLTDGELMLTTGQAFVSEGETVNYEIEVNG